MGKWIPRLNTRGACPIFHIKFDSVGVKFMLEPLDEISTEIDCILEHRPFIPVIRYCGIIFDEKHANKTAGKRK